MSRLTPLAALLTAILFSLPNVSATDFPAPAGMKLVYSHDFEDQQTGRYQPTDDSAWSLLNQNGNHVLALTKRNSNFSPPFRSPLNRTLIRDLELSSFVMDLRFQSTIPDYGHRDLCLFFGCQSDSKLYYVHFGKQADDHANQIFDPSLGAAHSPSNFRSRNHNGAYQASSGLSGVFKKIAYPAFA